MKTLNHHCHHLKMTPLYANFFKAARRPFYPRLQLVVSLPVMPFVGFVSEVGPFWWAGVSCHLNYRHLRSWMRVAVIVFSLAAGPLFSFLLSSKLFKGESYVWV